MSNYVQNTNQSQMQTQPKFSAVIQAPNVQKLINNTLKDPNRAARFVTAISSAVATNPALQGCEPNSIISGALLGESLNLSPSPQLGQYYLVPYEDKKHQCKVAQFQMGYKGYIQLAIRSGQYKKLNVVAVKEGELVSWNEFEEEIRVNIISNGIERAKAKTVGYYAFFEYTNGFRKAIYWDKGKMLVHADTYSQAFSLNGNKYKVSYEDYLAGKYNPQDAWKYSSFWYKDFDGMAFKTMLRQLISKWGVMSIEMQQAMVNDMAEIQDDGTPNYIDSQSTQQEVQKEIDNNANKGETLEFKQQNENVENIEAEETTINGSEEEGFGF